MKIRIRTGESLRRCWVVAALGARGGGGEAPEVVVAGGAVACAFAGAEVGTPEECGGDGCEEGGVEQGHSEDSVVSGVVEVHEAVLPSHASEVRRGEAPAPFPMAGRFNLVLDDGDGLWSEPTCFNCSAADFDEP
jgi:hypothetical protein